MTPRDPETKCRPHDCTRAAPTGGWSATPTKPTGTSATATTIATAITTGTLTGTFRRPGTTQFQNKRDARGRAITIHP